MALSNALAENGTAPNRSTRPRRSLQAGHRNHRQAPERQRRRHGLDAATFGRSRTTPRRTARSRRRSRASTSRSRPRLPESPARRVVLAGASGLIGSALAESLRSDGVEVTSLVRHPASAPDEVQWLQDATPLDRVCSPVPTRWCCLNGARSGRFPWDAVVKSQLLWSRITRRDARRGDPRTRQTTRRAGERLGDRVLRVAAGCRAHRDLAPRRRAPRGHLRRVGARGARAGSRARVALLRTAPKSTENRASSKPLLLLTARRVVPVRRGTQVWPWITLEDEGGAIGHVIDSDLDGPVNLTGPTRATANDLGFALARRMNRPYVLRALRVGVEARARPGPDGGPAHLGCRLRPAVLENAGFTFLHRTRRGCRRVGGTPPLTPTAARAGVGRRVRRRAGRRPRARSPDAQPAAHDADHRTRRTRGRAGTTPASRRMRLDIGSVSGEEASASARVARPARAHLELFFRQGPSASRISPSFWAAHTKQSYGRSPTAR